MTKNNNKKKPTINLYSTDNCVVCNEVKVALAHNKIKFNKLSADDDADKLLEDCRLCNVSIKGVKAAPVMFDGKGSVWTGYDCLVAIEEGELEA